MARKSVDLTTLPGWEGLSTGTHNITIVAKADGYRDSEPSAEVSVQKTTTPTLISFTIDGTSYQAEEGMTWEEWCNSSYNTNGFYYDETRVYINPTDYVALVDGSAVSPNAVILSGTNYSINMCFVEGTKITLPDGSTKPVQDIQYGDNVLCYDFYTGKQTTSYIDWMIPERIATKYWEITLSDGTILNLVGSNGKSHRLYNVTKQRFDYPQDFEADDITLKEDGTTAYILSCREIEKEVRYYNIASHEHINVYANGVLTSNRLNNRFKIVDNKFTDEKVMTDKEVADYIGYLERIRAK